MKSEQETIFRRLQRPPSEEDLRLLPIFTGKKSSFLNPESLHRSYYPDVSVGSILFNNRAKTILEIANIKTIGDLLLTAYTDLLLYRNCGLQTIESFQSELRAYLLDKEFDYSPYWEDIESMLRNVLNIKERNLLILLYRFGVNQPKAMTLQLCGDKFGITREAVRQSLNQIFEIMLHPETEYKLRPFWLTVDKVLKKKDILFADELSKKIKEKLGWKNKPEVHVLEKILKLKPERYTVAINHVVGFRDSECFQCDKLDGFLPKVMGDSIQLPYKEVISQFLIEFDKCCSKAAAMGRQFAKSLVDLHLREELRKYPHFKRKPLLIINEEKYRDIS